MFEKTRRYKYFQVFIKYNLFFLLYKDIRSNYISNSDYSCNLDLKYRASVVKLREAFEELGLSFIKLGQLLSIRPDVIPKTYIIELQKFQDKVQPLLFESMRPSFEKGCVCTIEDGNEIINYAAIDILNVFDVLIPYP